MNDFWTDSGLVAASEHRATSLAAGAIGAVLAVLVFYIDTFTNTEGAVAVLYGLAMLLAADLLSRRGLGAVAALFFMLTILSFAASQGGRATTAMEIRLVVSLAAIVTTAVVLIRQAMFKERVVTTNVALKRSESNYRSIFEHSRVALWEQDFSRLRKFLAELRERGVTNIRRHAAETPGFFAACSDLVLTVQVNQATHDLLHTKAAGDVEGSIRRFVLPDEECFVAVVETLFKGGSSFEGTGKLTRGDGTKASVIVGLSFPPADLSFDPVCVAMFDLTQRELTQQALIAAQGELARASRVASIGALSVSIAHELNQPIGAVVLNAQSCLRWLRRDVPDIVSAVDAAERIVTDGHRAAEILKSTRQMVARDPVKISVDLTELIAETCVLLEHEIMDAGVVLHTKMPTRVPRLKIARAELQQVLVNILGNGIHALEAKERGERRLSIECAFAAGWIRISLRDSGPGIANEDLPRLFEPFFTTKTAGMGIGLSISRSLVEGQGGKLTALNHPDGGAVFEIRIPVEASDG